MLFVEVSGLPNDNCGSPADMLRHASSNLGQNEGFFFFSLFFAENMIKYPKIIIICSFETQILYGSNTFVSGR